MAREPAPSPPAYAKCWRAGYDPLAVRATAERFTWEANAVALRTHLMALVG